MPDPRANLEALFREYRPRLHTWMARRIPVALRRRIDPDDVLQDAFLIALRQCADDPARQPAVTARAWIYTVVRDCYLDHWQRHTRDCRDYRRDEPWPDQSSVQQEVQRIASCTTPSEAAARMEERQSVLQVMQLLDAEERELLEWHWWEGFSHAEVAAVLGISEEAARQRHSRAFRRFSRLWQQQAHRNGKTQ